MSNNYHSVFTMGKNYINILPYLYRYENQEYIDKFFQTGELFISCFSLYQNYKDDQLGDKSEGSANLFGRGNGMTTFIRSSIGDSAFCFCTSTLLNSGLKKSFKRDGVFKIIDPLNFMIQVEQSLTRVSQIFHGNCIYSHGRTLIRDTQEFKLDDLNLDDGSSGRSMEKMMQVLQPFDPKQLFVKNDSYHKQSEYRIIFNTDRPVNGSIIIHVPEAIQYCEKIG